VIALQRDKIFSVTVKPGTLLEGHADAAASNMWLFPLARCNVACGLNMRAATSKQGVLAAEVIALLHAYCLGLTCS
jgi:hypothetical protein